MRSSSPDPQGIRVVDGARRGLAGDDRGREHLHGRLQVPRGAQSLPHYHADCESAVYMLPGRLNVRWGEGLEHAVSLEPGDMFYVPPRETHLLENPSEDERGGVRRRARHCGRALRRSALGAVAALAARTHAIPSRLPGAASTLRPRRSLRDEGNLMKTAAVRLTLLPRRRRADRARAVASVPGTPAAAKSRSTAAKITGGHVDRSARQRAAGRARRGGARACRRRSSAQAFSAVTPAGAGQEPDPAQVQANKAALLKVLAPYGVTNERSTRSPTTTATTARPARSGSRARRRAKAVVRSGKVVVGADREGRRGLQLDAARDAAPATRRSRSARRSPTARTSRPTAASRS